MRSTDCSPYQERPLTRRAHQVIGDRLLTPWVWGVALAVVGVVDVWGSRYNLNPDGVSYIEMARHALVGAPDGFINGYWSPGYPVLVAPILSSIGHDWVTAIPVLHVVNLVIFLLAGWLCIGLLRAVPAPAAADPGPPALGFSRYAFAFGAAAYGVVAIKSIGLGLLTPDFGVMLAILATAGCCLQLERSARSWRWSIALGVVLGLGYWMKGIMLPLNGLLLLGLFAAPPRTERARLKIAGAAMVFGLVCLPLVVMVSAKVGRLTMGEVGRLNYAWEVDGVTPFIGWVGDSTTLHGTPAHPPRVLQAEPQTLEFAAPIDATYALWFDPSYWYAGVRPRFDAPGQWRVLLQGLQDFWLLVQQQLVLVIGVAVLFVASAGSSANGERPRVPMVLGLWSLGATIVYALVHVEPRYLAGFIVVGVVVAWMALARRTPRRVMPWVMGAVVTAMLISLGQNIEENTGGFQSAYRPDYLLDAENLGGAGMVRGDRVAMVGDAFEAYAAFSAGTPITVQVMDSIGFWQLTPAGRLDLQRRIAATGVKALLANNVGTDMAAEGWRIFARDDASNLAVLLLVPR